MEVHHLETAHPLEFSNISVVANGPLRAAIRAETKIGQSKITVTVRIPPRFFGYVKLIGFADLPRRHRGYAFRHDGVKQCLMKNKQRLSSVILGPCSCSMPSWTGTSVTSS